MERRGVWSVSALVLAVSDALAARFAACRVEGEISGFSRAASGHCYFSLKDAEGAAALLRCAMFRRVAGMLDFSPRDGQKVEISGRLAVYEPRGELQFVVESMRVAGAGSLYELFLRLKARLAEEGLFDDARKRALPRHPRTIGIVTSLGAAALRDVVTTLSRRAPQVQLFVYPSLVQGGEAPASLVQALQKAQDHAAADVLLLVRGGGSLEDLWAFNDEAVVRAVAACAIPVISGVGHETDVTLCDFAADHRAATPTAAAEIAAPVREELWQALELLQGLMARAVHRQLDREAQRLDHRSLMIMRPAAALADHRQRLQGLAWRLQAAARALLQQGQEGLRARSQALMRSPTQRLGAEVLRLARLQGRLEALDPARVLQRGYAWVTDEEGSAVTSALALKPGQTVTAVWQDGQAQAQIKSVGSTR